MEHKKPPGVCAHFLHYYAEKDTNRRISIPLSSALLLWILPISALLHSCCDNDLWATGHTWRSSFLSCSLCFTHTRSPFNPTLSLRYLWCQLSIGDDFGNQAPLSVAGGVVDHLLPQQLAHRHVLEAVALGNLQALGSLATARAAWAQRESFLSCLCVCVCAWFMCLCECETLRVWVC